MEQQQKMTVTEYLNGVAKTLLDIGPMTDKLVKENEDLKKKNAELEAKIKELQQPA